MPRRTSIAALMGLILLLGIGLAAIRDPSEFWASALFTLALAAMLGSLVGVATRRGPARAAWLGFALFGWSSLAMSFGPWPWLNNNGLRPPPLVMGRLYPYLFHPAGSIVIHAANHGVTAESFALSGPGSVHINPPGVGGIGGVLVTVSTFDQVMHSLGALAFAAVGAAVGRLVAGRGVPTAAGASSGRSP